MFLIYFRCTIFKLRSQTLFVCAPHVFVSLYNIIFNIFCSVEISTLFRKLALLETAGV